MAAHLGQPSALALSAPPYRHQATLAPRSNCRRVARYSPLGAKSRELSLAGMTDRALADLLAVSQPAWTAPELGYRR